MLGLAVGEDPRTICASIRSSSRGLIGMLSACFHLQCSHLRLFGRSLETGERPAGYVPIREDHENHDFHPARLCRFFFARPDC